MTEANTQAEFYHHARLLGIPVELELTTPVGRLDIAILSKDRTTLLAIVECKRDGTQISPTSRQMYRYRSIGVPVYELTSFDKSADLADKISAIHSDEDGILLSDVANLPKRTRRRSFIYEFDTSPSGRQYIAL